MTVKILQKLKTPKGHKCHILYGAATRCECGWESSVWFGKGARSTAYAEWNHHIDKCKATGNG